MDYTAVVRDAGWRITTTAHNIPTVVYVFIVYIVVGFTLYGLICINKIILYFGPHVRCVQIHNGCGFY